jgi:hypothetical protein
VTTQTITHVHTVEPNPANERWRCPCGHGHRFHYVNSHLTQSMEVFDDRKDQGKYCRCRVINPNYPFALTDIDKFTDRWPWKDNRILEIGDIVKLSFEPKGTTSPSESMWVQITSATSGRYIGRLRNDPVIVPIKFDYPVEFGAENVIKVQGED